MREKKSQYITLSIIFLGATLIWGSTIFWMPLVTDFLLERSGKCEAGEYTENCSIIISTYGATGDIFGVITSLFSGLALFAVAATLWFETKSKREDRKPLITPHLDENSIILDSPTISGEKEITLKAAITAINEAGETALNVSINCTLNDERYKVTLPKKYLKTLLKGGSSGDIEIQCQIQSQTLLSFLSSLTEDGKHINLDIEVQYQSLEDIHWSTAAAYELRCSQPGQRKKLNAARANNGDFDDLWANNAAVALEATIKDGSWKHKKI